MIKKYDDLWQQFITAIEQFNGFNATKVYADTPLPVQAFLVNPSGIREYIYYTKKELETTVYYQFNNFMNQYYITH